MKERVMHCGVRPLGLFLAFLLVTLTSRPSVAWSRGEGAVMVSVDSHAAPLSGHATFSLHIRYGNDRGLRAESLFRIAPCAPACRVLTSRVLRRLSRVEPFGSSLGHAQIHRQGRHSHFFILQKVGFGLAHLSSRACDYYVYALRRLLI